MGPHQTDTPGEADSGDDSDIQEIAVVPPDAGSARARTHYYPSVKRRRSSPLMDPIPTYTPTPLHILQQRSIPTHAEYPSYSADVISSVWDSAQTTSVHHAGGNGSSGYSSSGGYASNHDDYRPLLGPSPSVVGCTIVTTSPEPMHPSNRRTTRQTSASVIARPPPASNSATRRTSRSSALQPVATSALTQAIARRRNSQTSQSSSVTLTCSSASRAVSAIHDASPQSSSVNAEEPVMWSPQLPSQIKAINEPDEDNEKYTSPRITKQRVAHKPTIPKNKQGRPRVPLGVAKKVPIGFRVKYLDVVINEYLNTGHPEEESYQEALKEEQALATRAATKSIYMNLIAGLKKKIREKAGISTLPQDEDPKYVNGNKVVSHSEILTGRVTGTFSIERKRKNSDPAQLGECELYDRLSRYLVPDEELEAYGYPCADPSDPNLRKAPLGKDGQKQQLRVQLASSYTCERCTKVYRVDADGLPLATTGKCIYHNGHLWNERINRNLEKRYSCCKGDPSAGGCSSNPYHVHRGELELPNYKGFVETLPKPDRDPNKHGIYALDCEMCYTTYGLELTRVTVINYKSDVVYEKLVKPANTILDYNTKFSGIKPGDLDEITTSLADVQQDLLEMFSSRTILVGHSLDSDMKALKIFHKRFIDTAQLFPHKRGLPFKRALRTLMVENLSVIIQEDAGHDSKEDASAAFRLVMWKAKTDVPEKTT